MANDLLLFSQLRASGWIRRDGGCDDAAQADCCQRHAKGLDHYHSFTPKKRCISLLPMQLVQGTLAQMADR
jgi:hypothetical protein